MTIIAQDDNTIITQNLWCYEIIMIDWSSVIYHQARAMALLYQNHIALRNSFKKNLKFDEIKSLIKSESMKLFKSIANTWKFMTEEQLITFENAKL